MLGEAIKRYRQQKNLTQMELAKMLSCSIDSIRRWEANTREPRTSELQKLALALGCSEADLLNGTSNEKIKVTISHDWEEYEKGEINMDGNLFELFLGTKGQLGLKGAGLPTTREELQELKERICNDLDSMFELQVKRGAIQTA